MKPNAAITDWVRIKGNSAAKLARLCQLEPPVICRAKHGQPVSLRMAIILEKGTKGEIRAEDVVSRPEDAKLIEYMRSRT